MARRTIDEQIASVAALRSAPAGADVIDELRQALASRTSLLAAKAADVTRELGLRELIPDLVSAFQRCVSSPASDKGCNATLAIVKALHELDADEADVYLAATRHVQMEAVWGGRTDTATSLRAAGAIALARLPRANVLYDLVPLLVDASHIVRAAAAQAISAAGRPEGALLLRLKILTGDAEPEVIVECFTALLQLEREAGLDFVGAYLDSADDALVEAAALAMGTARLPGAFRKLRHRLTPLRDEPALPAVLLALATLRTDDATGHLLDILRDAPTRLATAALDALKIHRSDARLRRQIEAIVDERDEMMVRNAFEQTFG